MVQTNITKQTEELKSQRTQMEMEESRDNVTDNRVLSFELLLPVVENTDLLFGDAVEGGRDVLQVLAHLGEGSAGVLAGEHGVGSAGTVKGVSGGDVEDAAPDGDVDGLGWVGAVVLAQLLGSEFHG